MLAASIPVIAIKGMRRDLRVKSQEFGLEVPDA
jgi:hypothetical protein